MSFPIVSAIQAVSGLAGLLRRPKKNPFAGDLAQGLSRHQSALDRLTEFAARYDPSADDQASIKFAEESAGRALANAHQNLLNRYKISGGNPSADTNFLVGSQRTSDDILNPLAEYAARLKASQSERRLNTLLAVLRATDPGAASSRYFASSSRTPRPSAAASALILAEGIDGIINGRKTTQPSELYSSKFVPSLPERMELHY